MIKKFIFIKLNQATKMQAPPTALILLSAVLLKSLALTTTGWLGSLPFPRTLKNPALVTSMTGAYNKMKLLFPCWFRIFFWFLQKRGSTIYRG